MNIEEICSRYSCATKSYEKNRLLEQAFNCYRYLAIKKASKYTRLFPTTDPEDWMSLVRVGVWEGLERCQDPSCIRYVIHYRILHNIAKEKQILVSKKQSWPHECSIDSMLPYNRGIAITDETRWITAIDIERAISKLPRKKQVIVRMWMEGYNIVTEICPVVNLKDASVYNYLNDALVELGHYLVGHEL